VKCKRNLSSLLFCLCKSNSIFYRLTPPYIRKSRDKVKAAITKKEEQSQQMATKIQEMQSAMQRAAVEAAKAVAAGQS
jgi:hypothetical protein